MIVPCLDTKTLIYVRLPNGISIKLPASTLTVASHTKVVLSRFVPEIVTMFSRLSLGLSSTCEPDVQLSRTCKR